MSQSFAGPNASNSPALPGDYSGRGGEGFPQAASHQAGGSVQTLNSQDTVSITSIAQFCMSTDWTLHVLITDNYLSLQQPSHRTEELVSKYVSNVHAKPQKSGGGSEIKRTMKASRIQRDVVSCILYTYRITKHYDVYIYPRPNFKEPGTRLTCISLLIKFQTSFLSGYCQSCYWWSGRVHGSHTCDNSCMEWPRETQRTEI